jgi:uncharacterized protein YbjT (DUF2867 family)
MKHIAIVIGATGLTGRALLAQLSSNANYAKTVAIVRRPIEFSLPNVQSLVCDFESWANAPEGLARLVRESIDTRETIHAFCCLGTTIKVAGSQDAFRRVDFDYVVAFAKAMKSIGASHIGTISALGASAKSSVFYSRTKGEMEAAVAEDGIASTHFVRPSFLDGDRHESRPGEKIGIVATKLLTPMLLGSLKRYRVVNVERVAVKLIAVAAISSKGVQVSESETLG